MVDSVSQTALFKFLLRRSKRFTNSEKALSQKAELFFARRACCFWSERANYYSPDELVVSGLDGQIVIRLTDLLFLVWTYPAAVLPVLSDRASVLQQP